MTDATLIDRYLKGDIGAFNTLVWRWEKPMYTFICRTICNNETAKDLCQILFIKMYKDLKKLRDPEKLKPWMYRIALNLCRDEMRRTKRQRLVYIDDQHDNTDYNPNIIHFVSDNSKSPEDLVNGHQIAEILQRSLMSIPDEQRTVIVMKQYQGLKFNEIAAILDLPVNTIKSRLYYGLKALKKVLEASKCSKEVLLNEM